VSLATFVVVQRTVHGVTHALSCLSKVLVYRSMWRKEPTHCSSQTAFSADG
jgi:hypothetical protein